MIFFFSSKTDLSVKGKESERGGSNGDRYSSVKREIWNQEAHVKQV